MSQTARTLNQQQLKSLCGVVAHTSEGLTKSELTTLLGQCGMCAVDDGSFRNQFGYTTGLSKRDWLYNCLVAEISKSKSSASGCLHVNPCTRGKHSDKVSFYDQFYGCEK